MITNKADTMPPKARTVTLTVPSNDYSLLRSITSRMGWTITPAPRKRKATSADNYPVDYDFTPNATTIRAMRDGREGKVFHAASAEDLIHQILG